MKTTKTLNDQPAPGHAILERTTDSFRRSVNGAWLPGGSTQERFEIPLATLNTPQGAGWLNPGRCGHVTLKLEDGSWITVCGANDPLRTSGFGELGSITGGALINRPHPLLPNLAPTYSSVKWFSDETLAGFQPYED